MDGEFGMPHRGATQGMECLRTFALHLRAALIPIALCWLSLGVGGQPVPTNAITVKEGPAHRDGVLDRIVAMDEPH